MPRYRPEPSTAGPLAQFIEIAFPAHFPSELEQSAQPSAARVLPEGIVDDVGLSSSWGRLHGRRDGFAIQVQCRSHLICLLMHILAWQRMHRAIGGATRTDRRRPCYVRQAAAAAEGRTMPSKREHAPLSTDL